MVTVLDKFDFQRLRGAQVACHSEAECLARHPPAVMIRFDLALDLPWMSSAAGSVVYEFA